MIISSDEAIRRARELANKVGWLTLSEKVGEEGRLIPSLRRIHLVGDYQDFEINGEAETGEILNWRCQGPLQIGINKIKRQNALEGPRRRECR